jgi:hypothetical protein
VLAKARQRFGVRLSSAAFKKELDCAELLGNSRMLRDGSDFHFGLDRVGNEALLVSVMMKTLFIGGARHFRSAVGDLWMERD